MVVEDRGAAPSLEDDPEGYNAYHRSKIPCDDEGCDSDCSGETVYSPEFCAAMSKKREEYFEKIRIERLERERADVANFIMYLEQIHNVMLAAEKMEPKQ